MSDDPAVHEWCCASCGEIHTDLPALVISAPAIWFDAIEAEPARDLELTSDTCRWRDEGFFVRCIRTRPFSKREGGMEFGVWSSRSQESLFRSMTQFENPERTGLGWKFGGFSNRRPGYPDTENLKRHVDPREPGLRPAIELEPTEHPLAAQQREGITFEEACPRARAFGTLKP
jgi:hypothetical protein